MDNDIFFIQERWLWLTGSVILALGAAWVRWSIQQKHRKSPLQWWQRWQNWSGRQWVVLILQFLYAIGIPALALFWRRILTERGLGLQPLPVPITSATPDILQTQWQDWVKDIGWTIGITATASLIRFISTQMLKRINGIPNTTPRDFGKALRDALYYQTHWAFYREPFVLIFGASTGTWAGLLPLAFETGLNPTHWTDWHTSKEKLLQRAFLAVVSAMLYMQTQNFWMLLLADILLGWGIEREEKPQKAA